MSRISGDQKQREKQEETFIQKEGCAKEETKAFRMFAYDIDIDSENVWLFYKHGAKTLGVE